MRVRVVRSLTCSCAEEDHRNCQEVAQVHDHASKATEPNFSEWGGNNGKICAQSRTKLYNMVVCSATKVTQQLTDNKH